MSGLAIRLDCPGDRGFRLGLDCTLPGAGVTAICGPSGSGKTTLLECIAGLRDPGPGALVRLGDTTWHGAGDPTPPWRRDIGYVFSDARLFPHLSVRGNLDYARKRRAPNAGADTADVVAWLELDELLERRPETLSAGQRQRVAIGRALLRAPRLLLLDEPLANLDAGASTRCLRCLQRLTGELALPMIYVSHAIEEVTQLADHLLLLEAGRAVAQGPLLELCSRLDNRLSREEGAAAILHATVASHDAHYGLTALDVEGHTLWVTGLDATPGSGRRVRIPARDVSLCRRAPDDSSILNILPVTIDAIEYTGAARATLRLALGGQFLLARITRRSVEKLQLQPGDNVYTQIKSAALLMEATDPP
ncbi:MAG: molybdenum ABC transporter ATP-binding protein [Halioglobus sp.]|nr:molybdenum ABC transporter ATP-binding protein [Halioglobus sp.]